MEVLEKAKKSLKKSDKNARIVNGLHFIGGGVLGAMAYTGVNLYYASDRNKCTLLIMEAVCSSPIISNDQVAHAYYDEIVKKAKFRIHELSLSNRELKLGGVMDLTLRFLDLE
jgi:hypothetical protein